jgi:serine-type D-Ala-D-Ala carboxypeptidase (penicillin-binding protein 5/6)
MNKRAAQLGMTHSHFTNAWGRSDPNERVSARDLALLARHIIRDFPEFYHYFGEKDFTWSKIHQLNRNPLLTMNIGADGLKTGDTAESGFGLVGSAVQDGQRLILVVNGYKTANERAEDSRRLLNWGFRGFDVRVLYQPGDTVGRAEVYGGDASSVELTPLAAVKMFVPKVGADKMAAKIVYPGPLRAPVEAGRKLGELRIFQAGTLVLQAPLQTKTAVGKGALTSRAADAAWELSKDWLRRQWKRQ